MADEKTVPTPPKSTDKPEAAAPPKAATPLNTSAKAAKGKETDTAAKAEREKREKLAALHTAIEKLEHSFGKGTVMRLGEKPQMNLESISTGSLSLDLALEIGGLPKGRIVEIFGAESSGKTTLALHVVAQAQKNGGEVAFIDAEHALDPVYARALGVDVDALLVSQPDNGEQALEIAEGLVRSGAVDLIVVDSVAALVPQAELDGHMGEAVVGLHARLMSQAMRKLAGAISKNNTIAIFINQVREKVGASSPYGPNEVTTGGRALKFYSSVRLEVKRGESLKTGDEVYGSHTRVKIAKNKTAAPFRIAEFDIVFGEGISRTGELIDLGLATGAVTQSGTWFSCDDQRLGQGKENAKSFLAGNPDMAAEIERKIRENADKIAFTGGYKKKKPLKGKEIKPSVSGPSAGAEDDEDDDD